MNYLSWEIGALVEYVLALLGLIVVLIITLVSVHRRGDPLRTPFFWFKISAALFLIFIILRGAMYILAILELTTDDYAVKVPYSQLGYTSLFLASVSDIFTQLCLIELALSCLLTLGIVRTYRSILRYLNIAILLILFALAVAALGLGVDWESKTDGYITYSVDDIFSAKIKLRGAFSVSYWISSLIVLSLSICVLYLAVRRKNLQRVSSLFLAACIFNLARTTYDFVLAVLYDLNADIYVDVPYYITVVDPILYAWLTIIVFGILMGIGYKKLNGLWSQQPPIQQGYGGNYGSGNHGGGIYGGGNHGGGNTFYGGQELPVGPSPTYYPQQQRSPSELIGSAGPTHRAEIDGTGYPNLNQQHYVPQNHQQPPLAQNQMQYVGPTPATTHSPTQQYNVGQSSATPGIPGSNSIVGYSSHEQQPQPKELSGISIPPDQRP